MPPIERPEAKACVREGLEAIADFEGEIESFTFQNWHNFHKTVFINAVATCIERKGSRIVLNEDILADFVNVGAFIDFVNDKAAFLREPEDNLQLSDGDLIPAN